MLVEPLKASVRSHSKKRGNRKQTTRSAGIQVHETRTETADLDEALWLDEFEW